MKPILSIYSGVGKIFLLIKHERNIYLDDLKRTVDNISSIRGVGVVDISGWLVTFLTSNLAIANFKIAAHFD